MTYDEQKSLVNLTKTLMDSICTHAAYHISNEKYRFAYVKAMARCYHLCSEAENECNLELIRDKIQTLRNTVPGQLQKRWFSAENGYYIMGLQHSLDSVNSVLTRFVRGYASADEYFVRNILERMANER